MSDQSRRLFHAVVVLGSALAVPAIAVGTSALAGISVAGCGDDEQGSVVDIGVEHDMSHVIDIGVVDIGVPPDMAHD